MTLDEFFRDEININVVKYFLPNISTDDNIFLKDLFFKILEFLYVINLEPSEENFNYFKKYFRNEQYKNAKWLFSYLLPHIINNSDRSKIFSLNDIVKKKEDNNTISETKIEPKYIYSNWQYDHCSRNPIKEVNLEKDNIRNNAIFLMETILKTSHKMYNNWIDIKPYSFENIEITNLYQNTEKDFLNGDIEEPNLLKYLYSFNDKSNESKIKYGPRFYLPDFYNNLINYYFVHVKDIKWLFYDYKDGNENLLNSIKLLDLHFNKYDENLSIIEKLINDYNWENLNRKEKEIFEIKYNSLLNNISDSTEINSNINIINKKNSLYSFLYGFYIYSCNNNFISNTEILSKNEYNKIKIFNILKKISNETVFEIFRNSLRSFRYSVYLYNICYTIDVGDNNYYFKIKNGYQNFFDYTPKNVYNFCESMTYYKNNNGDNYQLSFNFSSMTESEKKIIYQRINRTNGDDSWFRLDSYLEKLYPELNKNEKNKKRVNILNNLYNDVPYLLLTSLAINGSLTYIDFSNYEEKNENYKEMDNARNFLNMIKLSLNNVDKFNYIEYTKKEEWNKSITLRWISQLGFANKFLNNRINFITGATGAGKSTQIPKLYMYYSKILENNRNAKIACTEPRINATQSNAERVSKQLGLPITTNEFKSKTDFSHVQIKYQGLNWTMNNIYTPTLTFLTDGSLYNKIISPDFREKNHKSNIYDVLIIDEAHEHNDKMDLILTAFRTAMKNNSTLKLCILSATIDEDEPTYRRYYRMINDNLKIPFNNFIKNNNLDRKNVDRRFDISPPGSGTLYSITEIEKPSWTVKDAFEDIIKKGLNPGEDVLIFHSGKKDIIKTVDAINSNSSPNILAIPYIGSMSDDKKDIINNIALPSIRKKIKIDKDKDLFSDDLEKGNGNYNNFIVIATNIAEASITIKTLKYVIDTGNQNISIYDYKNKVEKLEEKPISNSSRIQRKGRVGRSSPGTVYYLYDIKEIKNSKPYYSISNINLTKTLFQLLRNKNGEEIYSPKKNNYDYIGNKKYYDYENDIDLPDFYKTGYDLETIEDNYGKFYLIHPDELNIHRNILGDIISINSDSSNFSLKNGRLFSPKMKNFVSEMLDYNLIDNNYTKTLYGILFYSFLRFLEWENEDLVMVLFNFILLNNNNENFIKDVCGAIIMLNDLSTNIKKISTTKFNWLGNRLDSKGDIDTLYKVSKGMFKNEKDLKSWCIFMNLDYNNINKFLKKGNELYNNTKKFRDKNPEISKIFKPIRNYSLLTSFITTKPYNVAIKIPDTNKYINFLKPKINSIYGINSISLRKFIPATSTSIYHLQDLIFFWSQPDLNDNVQIVNKVENNDLVPLKKRFENLNKLHFRIEQILEKKIEIKSLSKLHNALLEIRKHKNEIKRLPDIDLGKP